MEALAAKVGRQKEYNWGRDGKYVLFLLLLIFYCDIFQIYRKR